MFIVGERVNTSRKQINEAVANRDAVYIQSDVKTQVEAGADVIDVNAGSRRGSEVEDLLWLIDVIEDAVPQVRLCLDSSNPDSMKAVIGRPSRPPMLNSTTAEKIRFESMVQVIETRECDVVALCIDDRGIPKSVDQALENAVRLVYNLEVLGVNRERIYLDPVIQTTSTNGMAGLMAPIAAVLASLKKSLRDTPCFSLLISCPPYYFWIADTSASSSKSRALYELRTKGADATALNPLFRAFSSYMRNRSG